jgi:hypothetical protein
MSEIQLERNPSEEKLQNLGVRGWPIWLACTWQITQDIRKHYSFP